MKKTPILSALALLTLVLSACGGETGPRVQPPTTALPGSVTLTGNQASLSVPAGYTLSTDAPWLSLSAAQTTAETQVTLTARPLDALDAQASQPELRAAITALREGNAATISVIRPLTRVTGQVSLTTAASFRQAHLGGQGTAQSAAVDPGGAGQEVIVTYRAALGAQALAGARPLLSARTLQALPRLRAVAATSRTQLLRTDDVRAALQVLQADPNVLHAEPNRPVHAAAAPPQPARLPPAWLPGDEAAPSEWNYSFLNYAAVQADRPSTYPRAVTVALLDTGVQDQHPDLAGQLHAAGHLNLVAGAAATDTRDPGNGGFSHGTAVAGVIAAKRHGPGTDTGLVGGVIDAPVKLLNLRVLGADGSGDMYRVGLALRYAAGETINVGGVQYSNPHPAQVINVSLGGNAPAGTLPSICADVAAAAARGALVVASAGNDGTEQLAYPASCPDALSVGAVTLDAQKHFVPASYSQANSRVALAAPGGSDWDSMTYHNGLTIRTGQGVAAVPDALPATGWNYAAGRPELTYIAGTSAAAPMVSAVSALMLSKGVVSTPEAVRARLIESASDVHEAGVDPQTGAGVLNPVAALGIGGGSVASEALVQLSMQGRIFRPALGADLRFTAYLPGGHASLTLARDLDHDGEVTPGDPQRSQALTVSDGRALDLGSLTLP